MFKRIIIAMVFSGFAFSTGVFAQEPTATATPTQPVAPVTATPTLKIAPKTVDLACMQNSVDKRDTAIISSWDKFTSVVKSALETRKAALKSAWSNSDAKARREVIKKSWSDYRNTIRTARKTFNSERKAVWNKFNVERKNCGGLPEDATTESVDNQL